MTAGGGTGLAIVDYAVVASFFVVMVAVGMFFGRGQKSMAQFFGGGKQVPWWLSGVSFYMCSFSALAFVMYSALAYKYGWLPITISWLSVPAVLLSGRLFAARWRRVAETSPLEYIERRYGNGMRQSLTWLGLPMQILDNAFKLLALGTVVGVGMGFPLQGAIIGSGLIILCYTFMGGLWATLVADFIQFFILLTVILVLPFLCVTKAGGWDAFMAAVPPDFFRLTAGKYDWTYMLVFFLLIFFNFSTSWTMVQRYYSTRSEQEVRKLRWLVAALLTVGPPLFFLPAMTARVFLPDIPDGQMNEIYALLCKQVLPAGFLGMVIAAMFSATMSTLAGSYNAAASVLANDFYTRMIAPNASPKQQMVAARLATLLVGGTVIVLTFVMQHAQGANDLFDVTNKMFGIFLPPIAIPMMLGLVTRRISRSGGMCGLLGGIAAGVVLFTLGAWWPGLRATGVIFTVTCAATFAGLFLGTLLRPDDPAHDETLARFFEKVNTPSPVLEGAAAKITFWPLVAGGIACVGLVLIVTLLVTQPLTESRLSLGIGSAMLVVAGGFWWLSRRS